MYLRVFVLMLRRKKNGIRAFCAGFRLHYRYRYRYRLFGVFVSVTTIIVIVILIEVILALSYRNFFGFDIQHESKYVTCPPTRTSLLRCME